MGKEAYHTKIQNIVSTVAEESTYEVRDGTSSMACTRLSDYYFLGLTLPPPPLPFQCAPSDTASSLLRSFTSCDSNRASFYLSSVLPSTFSLGRWKVEPLEMPGLGN